MEPKRFVVIGGDAAGMSAASLAKRRIPDLAVEAFEMGDFTSYGACGMPYFVGGAVSHLDDLVVVTPDEFRSKRGIDVHMRHEVVRIDRQRRMVTARNIDTGQTREAAYDALLIATGAEPIVPEGIDLGVPGLFTLRGLPDAAGIQEYIAKHNSRSAVVVGTGYIGLEMAEALSARGLAVTILGRRPRYMGQYEAEISEEIEKELDRQQIARQFGAEVTAVEPVAGGRLKVRRQTGEVIEADVVVLGMGVRPRSRLARDAGLELGEKGAIRVDRRQRTSDPDIYAAGDCAEAYHRLLGRNAYIPLALTANRAGRVVGDNVCGTPSEFPGILGSAVCKVYDLAVARTGLGLEEARGEGLDVEKVVVISRSRPHYYPGSSPVLTVLIVERGTRRLWGAQMAGADGVGHRINIFAAAVAQSCRIDDVHALDLAYAPPFSPVWDPVLISCEVAMKKVR